MFVLAHASLWSWLEVEIEGNEGKAPELPTSCAFMCWAWYHICMNIIVMLTVIKSINLHMQHKKQHDNINVSIFVYHIFIFAEYTLYILLWFIVEDIVWFMIHPNYGSHKYNKKYIPWHASKLWIFGTFIHNWITILLCLIIAAYAFFLSETYSTIVEIAFSICFCVIYYVHRLHIKYFSIMLCWCSTITKQNRLSSVRWYISLHYLHTCTHVYTFPI